MTDLKLCNQSSQDQDQLSTSASSNTFLSLMKDNLVKGLETCQFPLYSSHPHTIIHPQCRIIKYQHLCGNDHGESEKNLQNKLVNGFFLRTLLLQICFTQFKYIYHEWTAFTILLIHSMTEYNHLCFSILFFPLLVTCNLVSASRSPESLRHVTRTEIVQAKQIFLNGMYQEKKK